jgi:iron(III) transport system ATP-binding protein
MLRIYIEGEMKILRVSELLPLMYKYSNCPQCGSDRIGNGEGKLIVDDNTYTRECKCGFKITTDENGQEIKITYKQCGDCKNTVPFPHSPSKPADEVILMCTHKESGLYKVCKRTNACDLFEKRPNEADINKHIGLRT